MRRLAHGRRGRHTGVVTLGLVFGTAVAALVVARVFDLGVAATLVTMLVGGGAPAALYLAWATYRDSRSEGTPLTLAGIADQLAVAVAAQWEAEAGVRRLNDPYPLSVSWEAADASLTDSWDLLVRLASSGAGWPPPPPPDMWAVGPRLLAGDGSDLVRVLAQVPTGRLVVLGEPGAGKTMLMVRLVLDLLSRRGNGGLVPVLVALASWNPEEQDLHDWLIAQLTIDHPALAAPAPPAAGEGSRIQALLRAGLILPVLDGLDEIPDAIRGPAITRINDALVPGENLVLTCRTEPYRDAVRPPLGVHAPLRAAAAIQLCPLDAGTISRYLLDDAAGPRAAERWEPVLAILGTPTPAAQALTTPLMVGLARTIYNPRSGEFTGDLPDPAELLSPDLDDMNAVQEHLFDAFIPAAYRQRRDAAARWTAEEAAQWLVFLARNLERRGTTNIEWWNLRSAIPEHLLGLLTGLAMGVVGAVGYPFTGLGVGLISGLLAGLMARIWVRLGKRGLARGLAGGLAGGVIAALIALAVLGFGIRDYRIGTIPASGLAIGLAVASMGSLAAGLAGGLAGGTAAAFYQQAPAFEGLRTAIGSGSHLIDGLGFGLAALFFVELASRANPARRLRWSPAWVAIGAASGLTLGITVWIQAGPLPGLAAGLSATMAGAFVGRIGEPVGTDLEKAASPRTVLRRDRATFLTCWLGLGTALGVSTGLAASLSPSPSGPPLGIRFGLELGVTNLIVPGLVFGLVQALWGQFLIARWWLAASRCLPLRLISFLDDAHEYRGILRQVGAAYQFRHIGLQHRLAGIIAVQDAEKTSAS